MIEYSEVFKIGRFYKPHGIGGEVVFAFTDDIFDRTESPYWLVEIDGILVPFFIESYRFRTDTSALVKIMDIENEKDAKLLSDRAVFYPKKYADGERSQGMAENWDFFKGFRVQDTGSGEWLGEIVGVDDSTLNVLFTVKKEGKELLIPVAEEFIDDEDAKERILYMTLPEGLMELG